MIKDEALKLALEFVESINLGSRSASVEQQRQVITAIKEALAQPEQELEGDCAPNHFCNGAFVHKPTDEICNKCGKE